MATEKYEDLDLEQLKAKLADLYDTLEDTEDLRDMQLGQTGHHVPGGLVKKYSREIDAIKEDIAAVETLIEEKK
ncbi:MAG: hypothetical protein ACK5MN_11550 [Lachnospiraceae bacterium]